MSKKANYQGTTGPSKSLTLLTNTLLIDSFISDVRTSHDNTLSCRKIVPSATKNVQKPVLRAMTNNDSLVSVSRKTNITISIMMATMIIAV